MNRRKKWITAALILLGAGILICGIAFAAAGFNPAKLSSETYEERTVEITEPFRNISIITDTDDIYLAPSEDESCKVVLLEAENRRHETVVEDQTLKITSENPLSFLNFFSFSFRSPSVTIYLPAREYASLNVEASTGFVSLPEELSFENVRVSLSTGDVTSGLSVNKNMDIRTNTGQILLGPCSAEQVYLSVTTGGVRAESLECSGSVEANVTTGDARLEKVNCGELYSKGSTGDLIMKDVFAKGKIQLERSTGDIILDDCDADSISATTSTGDVRGTLLSDKIFIVDTSTGEVDVPKTTSGGKCEIKTGTGDIKIGIVQK